MAAALAVRARSAGLPKPILRSSDPGMSDKDRAKIRVEYDQAMAAWRKALDLPWMGDPAGLAISKEPDVADLWQEMQDIRQRRRAWLKVIGSRDEFPAISSIKPQSIPNGDPPPPIDFRTEEEKARAIEGAWNAIASALAAVSPLALRYICGTVVRGEQISGPPLAVVLRNPMVRKALGK